MSATRETDPLPTGAWLSFFGTAGGIALFGYSVAWFAFWMYPDVKIDMISLGLEAGFICGIVVALQSIPRS